MALVLTSLAELGPLSYAPPVTDAVLPART
jgi:hypothetical protein